MMIAFNLAEPVLHCGCIQITPDNSQFGVKQSESVGQHRHLAGIYNYNIVLPPSSSSWFGTAQSAAWFGTTLPGSQAQSPLGGPTQELLFELLHHHPVQSSSLWTSRRKWSGFRDKAAPTVPSPTKSRIFPFSNQ